YYLLIFIFCLDKATTMINSLSLHDALPICQQARPDDGGRAHGRQCDLRQVAHAVRSARPVALHSGLQPHRGSDAEQQRRAQAQRSEEHTSELQSRENLVCRLLLEKKNNKYL